MAASRDSLEVLDAPFASVAFLWVFCSSPFGSILLLNGVLLSYRAAKATASRNTKLHGPDREPSPLVGRCMQIQGTARTRVPSDLTRIRRTIDTRARVLYLFVLCALSKSYVYTEQGVEYKHSPFRRIGAGIRRSSRLEQCVLASGTAIPGSDGAHHYTPARHSTISPPSFP
jgi:hypothetical protein